MSLIFVLSTNAASSARNAVCLWFAFQPCGCASCSRSRVFRRTVRCASAQKCASQKGKRVALRLATPFAEAPATPNFASIAVRRTTQRRKRQTLAEMIYPIYIIGIMVLVKFLTTTSVVHPPTLLPPAIPIASTQVSEVAHQNGTLAFAPPSAEVQSCIFLN